MVLMAVLTTGSTTTDWHHCGACGAGGQAFSGAGYEGCGCWGGYSNWGYCNMPPPNPIVMGGHGVAGGTVTPGTGTAVPGTGNGQEELEKPKKNKTSVKETMDPTRAKLLIELPAKAKLFIDDKPVKTALGVQLFDIPVLEPDKVYFYMVRIEMMRDGQPLSQTRRILVRAGQVTRTEFQELEPEAPRTARAK
ncbi:MAG TPA: TIGR03000 domain-containing protein [Gemmataceae bacterium]